jgi:YfiH family protein
LNLIAFVTQTKHGDARASDALARILKAHHHPTSFASAEQIHGSGVRIVTKLSKSRRFLGADGFLTDAETQPLAIFTADCVPIFLSAGGARVVGLLHAGWRGVQKRILPRAIRIIKKKWGIPPSNVQMWTGPHIGPCCFEVHWDVARHFPATRRRMKDRWRIDLSREIRRQASNLGVRWVSKRGFEGCTMHQTRFFSYRRDQTPKRQVSIIMKCKTR